MEMIERLSEQLGISRRQAEGGAGLLLEFAQQRLSPGDFIRVADTIPAISDVIGKAPRSNRRLPRPLLENLSRWFGGLGGLAGLAGAFEKVGCDQALIVAMVDALVDFFQEQGGEEVAALLRGVLR